MCLNTENYCKEQQCNKCQNWSPSEMSFLKFCKNDNVTASPIDETLPAGMSESLSAKVFCPAYQDLTISQQNTQNKKPQTDTVG